jgi:glutathione peroxidase
VTDFTNSIHQFSVRTINGSWKNLSDYSNKVLLIVNIASACGLVGQLKEMEALREEFSGQDFEILAFPSNDFGRQEPLESSAVRDFCEMNYGVRFSVFEKISVRGKNAHPLYQFLTIKSKPRWNYHKFLINKQGIVVDYFYPFTKPLSSKIVKKIQRLL